MCSEAVKLNSFINCPACLVWASPKNGDHCIYDSYGSAKCPPVQVKERRTAIADAGAVCRRWAEGLLIPPAMRVSEPASTSRGIIKLSD